MSFLKKLDNDLLRADDGRYNAKKIGELVAGVTWTVFMWVRWPEDVLMWTAYAGCIFTWGAVYYWKKSK